MSVSVYLWPIRWSLNYSIGYLVHSTTTTILRRLGHFVLHGWSPLLRSLYPSEELHVSHYRSPSVDDSLRIPTSKDTLSPKTTSINAWKETFVSGVETLISADFVFDIGSSSLNWGRRAKSNCTISIRTCSDVFRSNSREKSSFEPNQLDSLRSTWQSRFETDSKARLKDLTDTVVGQDRADGTE